MEMDNRANREKREGANIEQKTYTANNGRGLTSKFVYYDT